MIYFKNLVQKNTNVDKFCVFVTCSSENGIVELLPDSVLPDSKELHKHLNEDDVRMIKRLKCSEVSYYGLFFIDLMVLMNRIQGIRNSS